MRFLVSTTNVRKAMQIPLSGGFAGVLHLAPVVVAAAALAGCTAGPSGEMAVIAPGDYQLASLKLDPTILDPTITDPATHPLVAPLRASNDRNWSPEQAVLARAEFSGNQVTVRNIRNFRHTSDEEFEVDYYDETFDLDDVRSVDFLVVPFAAAPQLAHTMISFGFTGDRYLTVSVEARREKGEKYDSVLGMLDRYELMYVVGDERDLIQLRTNVWLSDVYLYRTQASPEQSRRLLVDVLNRANQLANRPEFYNTLANNCTTNIIAHVNRLFPGRVPLDQRIVLNGRSDRLAYDLGLLLAEGPFEQVKANARVNYLAYLYRNAPDFSAKIRR